MSERPQQFVAFQIGYRELAQHLGLPRDHRVVRVEMNDPRYGPPAICVVIEGPAGYLTPRGAPVCFNSGSIENWKDTVDEVREASIEQYGPYEW